MTVLQKVEAMLPQMSLGEKAQLLQRLNPDHFGIIVCTEDPDFDALANRINNALEKSGELLEGVYPASL